MTVLSWRRAGQRGAPPVVLIHDWAGAAADFEAAGWEAGLRGFDVLACDLPGHGDSDVEVPAERSPDAWAASAIEADLHHLRVSDAAAVGVGLGAVVAGHLATARGASLRALVLIGCDDGPVLIHARELVTALRNPGAPVWSAEVVEAVAKARGGDPATLARWAEAAAWPAAARLGALRTPTLLAVGKDDPRHEGAPRLAALFHDARLAIVEGDAMTALASPALVRAVARFVAEH